MIESYYHDGTARVPIEELKSLLPNWRKNIIGLDLGSGNGRSTRTLQEGLIESSSIFSLDQDREALMNGNPAILKVQALAEQLPFQNNVFDFIALNGLMTNLTAENPLIAQEKRRQVAKETYRCLRMGGVISVSDFSTTHQYSEDISSYENYQLITGEWGTIALYPGSVHPLRGLSENDVLNFARAHKHVGFVHHYDSKELTQIFSQAGFMIIKCDIEPGVMPSGRSTDALILLGVKIDGV